MTEHEALIEAIEKAGGQSALARKVGVKQAHVWYWLHKAKKAPPARVPAIERETNVSRHLLRPDVYGAPRVRRKTVDA
jgi:DNA-binding transcriptional regulator YdaS (Cro superfamily)